MDEELISDPRGGLSPAERVTARLADMLSRREMMRMHNERSVTLQCRTCRGVGKVPGPPPHRRPCPDCLGRCEEVVALESATLYALGCARSPQEMASLLLGMAERADVVAMGCKTSGHKGHEAFVVASASVLSAVGRALRLLCERRDPVEDERRALVRLAELNIFAVSRNGHAEHL